MNKTAIEWCDRTWSPVTGCTKISPGCQNCYAERMSKRLAGRCGYPKDEPFKVTKHVDKLRQPLHWRKHQRVFAGSMTDIFHNDVPNWMRDEIFGVILACRVLDMPSHTFMVLTKRADKMQQYFAEREPIELLKAWANSADWITIGDGDMFFHEYVESAVCHDWDANGRNSSGSKYKPWGYPAQLFPLSNLWLGVTAENQEQADKRIPALLETPAAKRFISVEPMLEQVDLTKIPISNSDKTMNVLRRASVFAPHIHWVICGSESGPGARPMDINWARNLRDQCQDANVPFFFKQIVENGKKKTMPELDGKVWGEWPEC